MMFNDKELLILIDHINASLSLFKKKFKNSNFDVDWKIYSFCMKNHFQNKLTNITSLINISGLPHSTGLRRINKLIEEKRLIKKSKTNN